MNNINIICLPGNLYDNRPWTNRQHIMTELAKSGSKILYLEAPKSILVQLAKIVLKYRPEQKTILWFKRLTSAERRRENLYIFPLIKFVSVRYRLFRKVNYLINIPRIKKQLKKIRMNFPILWIYSPDAVHLVGKLNEKMILYDCVDEYTAQPYYQRNFKEIEKDEIELLKKSHCVFTCSPYLQKKKKIFNKNTYFIGNPADYSHFSKAQNEKIQIPQDLLSIPKPIIGFIGAIDKYKIDFKLIQNLAVTNPNWSIVLVGGIGEAEKKANIRIFKKRKNIYLLGKKDYDILPNYIKAFDIAIIPYIKNEYTRCCAPLKLFEFLSSGKPVVLSGVTITKELKNIVKCANTFEEFEEAINKYLINDNQENRNRRINIAKENTWEKKIERQKNIIRKFYPTFRRF